jgi:hypothetical protein
VDDNGRVAARLPADVSQRIAAVVPLPEGFVAASSFARSDGDRHGVSVTGRLPTRDGTGILDALAVALADGGWSQRNRSNIDDHLLSLVFERGAEHFNVSVMVEGDEAMLTLMLIDSG